MRHATTTSLTNSTVVLVGLAVLLTSASATASGVVLVTDPHVAQYAQAADAARKALPAKSAELDSSAPDAADQLRAASPDVVLAVGQRALDLARQAVPQAATVYCMVLARNASPSRQVTGIPLEVAPADQLARFKQVHPGLKRLGVIYDPSTSGALIDEATRAAQPLGIALVGRKVSDPKEVAGAAAGLAGSVDALWLVADPRLVTREVFNYLLVFASERRVPLFGFLESFTQGGAVASVAPDYVEIGTAAARLASDLLAKPAEKRFPVPPPQATRGALSLNLKVAVQLGIAVPEAAVQAAHRVFR